MNHNKSYNRIAKGKPAFWLAIEEREFSVELHFMKGYCWRESRAKIVAIVKIKMQLVLGKKHLGNERIVCQSLNRNESHSHSKLRENALTLTLKGFPLFAHCCGSRKQKRLVALAMRFKKNSLPDDRYRTHRFAIRAISAIISGQDWNLCDMTSAILVHCSSNWAIKPTGNCSLCEFVWRRCWRMQ